MNWLKDYNSIPNFLIRKTILKINRLHIRLHDILSPDRTAFIHNHPFYYLSIIIRGGYEEELLVDGVIINKVHKLGSFIWRTPKDYHRIKSINGRTKTLFFTWKVDVIWDIKIHDDIISYYENIFPKKDGIYFRIIKDKRIYCKFKKVWYIGNEDLITAINENRMSIHQTVEYTEINKNNE